MDNHKAGQHLHPAPSDINSERIAGPTGRQERIQMATELSRNIEKLVGKWQTVSIASHAPQIAPETEAKPQIEPTLEIEPATEISAPALPAPAPSAAIPRSIAAYERPIPRRPRPSVRQWFVNGLRDDKAGAVVALAFLSCIVLAACAAMSYAVYSLAG